MTGAGADRRFALWTYPWDVQELGLETVIRDLLERAGVNGINIATVYHAGRFFQPRNPRRKTYLPEDGTVYFRPDPKLWAGLRLQPQVAAITAERDVLRALNAARDRSGLSVACWTVCLHNMRLGQLHPEVCTRNAFGEPSLFNLCPSHPDVRAYAVSLVRDLSRNYRPDIVQLETPGFMPYAHGYHHEKDGVGLTAEDDFLLSLCFCDACVSAAGKAGIDAEPARRMVRRWIEDASERAVPAPLWPDFVARGPAVFADHPEVEAFVRWRCQPVTGLIAAIREAAHPDCRIDVIDDGWRGGCDLDAVQRICDGIVFCAYDRKPSAVAAETAALRASLDPQVKLGVGIRLFAPEMQSVADIVQRSAAALSAGAAEIDYYNYGLVPAARLDWVRAAIAAALNIP